MAKPFRTITEIVAISGKRLKETDYRIREDDKGKFIRHKGMSARLTTETHDLESDTNRFRLVTHQITHYEAA